MHRFLAILVVALGLVAVAGRAAHAKPSIAILGLEVIDDGTGIDEKTTRVAKDLTDALRQRAKIGTGPFQIAPGSDKELLEMKLLSGCDSEGKDCMAEIGSELAADRLLYGKIEKRQGGYQVSLKLLNVATKANDRAISDMIPFAEASGADMSRWGKQLYNKLTGATDQGTLAVKANVDRGTVLLDGQVKGSLVGGTARIVGLTEGVYMLGVEAEGHLKYEAKIRIIGGEDTKHEADLETNALHGKPTPPKGDGDGDGTGIGDGRGTVSGTVSQDGRSGKGSRVMFWTTLVLTAGSATAMTITGMQVRGSIQDDKEAELMALRATFPAVAEADDACAAAEANNAPGLEGLRDICKKGQDRALLTNVLIGTTVVGALATVYFYYKGYVAPSSETAAQVARRNRKRGPIVTVAPTVAPTQIGAGVRIDF